MNDIRTVVCHAMELRSMRCALRRFAGRWSALRGPHYLPTLNYFVIINNFMTSEKNSSNEVVYWT
jgi:hypothetical protein